MTRNNWRIAVMAIRSVDDAPQWLKEQAQLGFDDVMRLPPLDLAKNGHDAAPILEEKVVESDYLEFLREQIRLGPRGPEWTIILKQRLSALEPFVGKKLITIILFRKPHSITLRVNPETKRVLQMELA